jgi:hypothetical protein
MDDPLSDTFVNVIRVRCDSIFGGTCADHSWICIRLTKGTVADDALNL